MIKQIQHFISNTVSFWDEHEYCYFFL